MLMELYMEDLILGINTTYMHFCFFELFPTSCIELIKADAYTGQVYQVYIGYLNTYSKKTEEAQTYKEQQKGH